MAEQRSHQHNQLIPELRGLHSPNILDLELSSPEDQENFCILVQAMIGPKGEAGEESFDFVVCTPQWLAQFLSKNTFVFGRHYLVINCFSYEVLWEAISSICQTTSGSSWSEVGEYLSRYGKWEFEDYHEYLQ